MTSHWPRLHHPRFLGFFDRLPVDRVPVGISTADFTIDLIKIIYQIRDFGFRVQLPLKMRMKNLPLPFNATFYHLHLFHPATHIVFRFLPGCFEIFPKPITIFSKCSSSDTGKYTERNGEKEMSMLNRFPEEICSISSRSRVLAHRPCPKLEMFCPLVLQLSSRLQQSSDDQSRHESENRLEVRAQLP